MKLNKKDLYLYAVTDRRWANNKTLLEQIEETIKGGATMIQLREKELPEQNFICQAMYVRSLCKDYQIPFIINDNVDVAIKIGADGVHLGKKDTPIKQARKKLGESRIIGASVENVRQAIDAQKNGADYIGVGPLFTTRSKNEISTISLKTLKEICENVIIPVVAIGGINLRNISKLKGTGISGVAVISAIFAEKDILKTTQKLKLSIDKLILN
ncbi:thiamine phosphate synthase [[Mycoplasma] testudinis]|uniref:thiamine phosphate synthase n=1 Tax=[Mycoplasma] testudinis TaxID=33924 RepID=UPI0004855220|nr:thiamine phosphate synthase [[Mycoplasma] testudinis]